MHYKKAIIDSTQEALDHINWRFLFSDKSVPQQVKILNNTLMNVFPNFILIKLATFNDKDPFWMLEYLKEKLNGATNVDYITLKNIIAEVSELV